MREEGRKPFLGGLVLLLICFCSCSEDNTGIVVLPESSSDMSTMHSEEFNQNARTKVAEIPDESIITESSCEYEGWKVSINGYNVYKELSGENLELDNQFVEKAIQGRWATEEDEDLSYVIVNIQIENLEPIARKDFCFDHLLLIDASDPDAYLDVNSVQVTSYFPTQRPPEHNLYYWNDFAPREVVEKKLLFVVPDSFLNEKKLLFCFCPGGTSFSPMTERELGFPYFLLSQ